MASKDLLFFEDYDVTIGSEPKKVKKTEMP